MADVDAAVGLSGSLDVNVRRHHTARSFRLGKFGRVMFTRDPGEGQIVAQTTFPTHLSAVHRDGDGNLIREYDLGSGLVTNVGVTALANDYAWAQNCQTLKLANYHAWGTGTTAAATSDLALQTAAAPTNTTATAGTQSLVSAANSQTYKTSCTLTAGGALAITEWGLFTAAALSATTGTPATATSATSLTATGTPYTASSGSVQGEQQLIVKTGTTASYGLILSNTSSVLTIPAWYKTADGTAGTTPGGTEAFTLLPVMFDHRVFSVINLANLDTITFNYSLLVQSGG